MSAAAVLPFVWATESSQPMQSRSAMVREERPPLEVAFYRKYTEGLLRRYVRLSMEAGRVPSLLGREMFRAKVTSYRVESFEDVVIFVHDVEKCLSTLEEEQQHLVARIALQEYTVGETAELMRMGPRTVIRKYGYALDRLTRIFLNAQMLEPQKCCQGVYIAS